MCAHVPSNIKMASLLKEAIGSTVKETLKEELSVAFNDHKNSADGESSDCNAKQSKTTLSFEEFYKQRESDCQKEFQPKKKKKEPSSSSTSTSKASKKVEDVEVKVGLAAQTDGVLKSHCGKTHTVKVKSNATREEIIEEAVKKHCSFDESFDDIPPYVLLYPDFGEVFFIFGTLNDFTLSVYKEVIGKVYKHFTFFLVQHDEFNRKSDESSEPESNNVPDGQMRSDKYAFQIGDALDPQSSTGNLEKEGTVLNLKSYFYMYCCHSSIQ